MLTVTRRQAQRIRTIMRRAFGTMRGPGPVLNFTADAAGLSVKAISGNVAVEFHDTAVQQQPTNLWLPFAFLTECEAKRDDLVELEGSEGKVIARWTDANVPKTVEFAAASQVHVEEFPTMPQTMTENPPALLAALADAADTTDAASARYALSCIQAQGEAGTLAASDGRQMLLQAGFQFPWQGDLLIPANRVFQSAELPHDQPVSIGVSEKWAALGCGPWTIHLRLNRDGRFPDLSRLIPRPERATARCKLSTADAAFLGQTLPRMPMDETENDPVTLELNGCVAVRSIAPGQQHPTEAELSNSTWNGTPIRLTMNRRYLARAARLGFEELYFYSTSTPMLSQDGMRRYIWAPLSPDGAVPASDEAIRIISPRVADKRPISIPAIERRMKPMVVATETPHVEAEAVINKLPVSEVRRPQAANHGTASKKEVAACIEQAESLRGALRELLVQTGQLVHDLKHQRRQNRAIESTLASLRQLKGLGV